MIMNLLKITSIFDFCRKSKIGILRRNCNKLYSVKYCTKNVTLNNLEGNPYFKKYEGKISVLKSSNLSEFQTQIDQANQTKCFQDNVKPIQKNQPSHLKKHQPTHTKEKKLDDIIRMELVEDLPAEEISKLWVEHFKDKDGICAIIPSHIYEVIFSRSVEYSTFLYPLMRKSGYEFMVGQFSGHSCYFTSLANFHVHKDNAPVCLTLAHYIELQDSKGIVLMRGEFDSDVLNAQEAQFLANQVQLYYGSSSVKKKLLLWTFNKEPQNFKHTDLIAELETIS